MKGRVMMRPEMLHFPKRTGNYNRHANSCIDIMQALIKLDFSYFSILFLIILVIISDQGASQQKSSSSTRQRWLQYQTALSNTGPMDSSDTTDKSGPESGGSGGTNKNGIININPSSSASSSSSNSVPPSNSKGNSNSSISNTAIGGGGVTSATSTNIGAQHNNNNRNSNTNGGPANGGNSGRKRLERTDGAPMFENNTSVNLTVPLGDTAFLRCRVRNLGERSISWIRRRDYHILTTGKTTFTNDERFHVLHTEGTDDFTLQIKFVQKRDQGIYECQVSSLQGILSYLVQIHVAVPEAFILGNGDEYHVEQGSTINLVCVIEKSPKVPEFIFWYHNERMINYGSSREVTVRTDPGAHQTRTQSRLTIRDARISDSGNYTCKTAHAEPASIYVYVSQASGLFSGDKIAAIQRRKSSTSSASSPTHTYHHPLPLYYLVHWLTTKMGLSLSLSQTFPILLSILSSSSTTGLSYPSTYGEFGLILGGILLLI